MSMTVTKEQAESFAITVYPDIKEYINTHKEEFELWKQNKEEKRKLRHVSGRAGSADRIIHPAYQ